jgi:hypothetical protein
VNITSLNSTAAVKGIISCSVNAFQIQPPFACNCQQINTKGRTENEHTVLDQLHLLQLVHPTQLSTHSEPKPQQRTAPWPSTKWLQPHLKMSTPFVVMYIWPIILQVCTSQKQPTYQQQSQHLITDHT